MLYENTVKIIPLEKEGESVVMKNSFNMRIRHPEAHKILPIYQEGELGNTSDGAIAVFY